MTLDEQIAWLEQLACDALRSAGTARYVYLSGGRGATGWPRLELEERERAAMLLTIENTLRALRDEAR